MITLAFVAGIVIGVVYDKSLLAWKNKAARAVKAAEAALKS